MKKINQPITILQKNKIIGYPLDHSQSPVLHRTIYQLLGLNAEFSTMLSLNLAHAIETIKANSTPLTAVTLPHKEAVLSYLDICSPEVEIIGSANTLIQHDGKLFGYNTDIDGLTCAFKNIAIDKKKALIIGAGGAARAMAYFLKKNQAEIFYLNRSVDKANQLAQIFGGTVVNQQHIHQFDLDILINTTPIGMYPKHQDTPLPNYHFQAKQVVFDMVYHPMSTKFLLEASTQQAKILSGLTMFIGQGLKQIELWTGKSLANPELIDKLYRVLINHQQGNR